MDCKYCFEPIENSKGYCPCIYKNKKNLTKMCKYNTTEYYATRGDKNPKEYSDITEGVLRLYIDPSVFMNSTYKEVKLCFPMHTEISNLGKIKVEQCVNNGVKKEQYQTIKFDCNINHHSC